MIRYIFLFFAIPVGLFWLWYWVSYFDLHFGFLVLSRLFHDYYFVTAGNMTGIPPEQIPGMLARVSAIDLGIILAIWAFRRRREIREWWQKRRDEVTAGEALEAGPIPPAE